MTKQHRTELGRQGKSISRLDPLCYNVWKSGTGWTKKRGLPFFSLHSQDSNFSVDTTGSIFSLPLIVRASFSPFLLSCLGASLLRCVMGFSFSFHRRRLCNCRHFLFLPSVSIHPLIAASKSILCLPDHRFIVVVSEALWV